MSITSENSISSQSDSWDTLQGRLAESIVSTSNTIPIVFDTGFSGTGTGTGFVVDAENGIILSNRHVMSAGPSSHKATFFNNQQVSLQPFYYDPEHDFAFFRYDPAELKGIKPRAIKLVPEKARSGLEIRTVGFTANEKMTVHQGELSQLDRNVPFYSDDEDTYNDLNTFYYQASGISGSGSSGSPVVDVAGDAVAIKCGANAGNSLNYLLPLQRVKYAFEFVRQGKIPPRGTLQTVFHHQSHVKAELLGLTTELAASEGIDKENSTGVLTVKKVVPKGPADGVLKVGDIVVSVNGTVVTGFPELFEIIDGAVGQNVSLRVFRNHEFTTVNATVQDIYQVTPTRALRLGKNIFHDMSFLEAATASSVAVAGVKVNGNFGTIISNYHTSNCKLITEVNYKPTPNLDAFMDIIQKIHSDEPIVVKAIDIANPRNEIVFVTNFLQTSQPDVLFTRSSATGFWSIEPFNGPLPAISKLEIPQSKTQNESHLQKSPPATGKMLFECIEQCKVFIEANPICATNGYYNTMDVGVGLVVDPQRGLILCSSRIGKNPASNFTFTIGVSRINATLAYIHPLYPFSVLKYSPEDIDHNFPNLELTEFNGRLAIGDEVTTLLGGEITLERMSSTVLSRGLVTSGVCEVCFPQQFFNIEAFSLLPNPSLKLADMAIVCSNDRISGILVNLPECSHSELDEYRVGLDISLVIPTLNHLRTSDYVPKPVRVLNAQFGLEDIYTIHALGVRKSHIDNLMAVASSTKGFYKVDRELRVHPTDMPSLRVGDIVLQVNGHYVKGIVDLASFDTNEVELCIVRNGKEVTLTIPTAPLCDANIRKIVCWAGMYLQEPFHSVNYYATSLASNAYNFINSPGAPSLEETYHDNMFVVEIGEHAINTLDDVVKAAKLLKDPKQIEFNAAVAENKEFKSGTIPGRDVKIRTVLINGDEIVKSIRTNDHYYPAWQLVRGPRIDDKWVYIAL
ncbi:hypothetical protein IWW36_002420 [Coemansia brasiliensis]|uniref:Pro-apoptotic serine protease NMA111 n=1 Tax=Coemansia brasiliensis TaxID=2650707 RepID=A0A9W8IFX5_9FUNG|nr:hypothetical protein IWW36_002420 [Coemansia brasiliensis]